MKNEEAVKELEILIKMEKDAMITSAEFMSAHEIWQRRQKLLKYEDEIVKLRGNKENGT